MTAANFETKYPWERITRRVHVADGSMPDFDYTVAPFDKNTPPVAHDIARLHLEILPTSPASKLGIRFLEDFYYAVLPQDDYIFGVVNYFDDKPVAFWVGTEDSNGFMEKAQRAHPARLAVVLGLTVLTNPSSIAGLLESRKLMAARHPSNEMVGEALSHGVLPEFRGRDFKSKTGVFAARDASNIGITEFLRRGVTSIKAVIDQTNSRNRERTLRRGWKLVDPDAAGWKVPSVEHWIDPRELLDDR